MTKKLWEIMDHVCRSCMGRIAKRVATRGEVLGTRSDGTKIRMEGGEIVVRCVECGLEAMGFDVTVRSVCACGIERQHGFRCTKNPHRSEEFPNEIVVGEAE